MIRSTSHSLKFSNAEKRKEISLFVDEYRQLLQSIINYAWLHGIPEFDFDQSKNKLDMKSLLPTTFLKQIDTNLSARLKQSAGKQAIMMLKAACKKRQKQLWMLNKLQRKGELTGKLQSKIDRQALIKPNAINANLELDSRFVDLSDTAKTFDFIRISSIGDKRSIKMPIKHTKPFKKWSSRGTLKNSVRLSKDNLWLMFDVKETKQSGTETVGADQGILTTLTLSNGSITKPCNHGHTLKQIQHKLSLRKKGSNGFAEAQEHRKNYINWSLNQLSFAGIKEVRLEKIKNIRFKNKNTRYLSHWKYTLIKDKLVRLGEEKGFQLSEIPNEFRSQRCSFCGWVRKANRKGKTFCCNRCGNTMDADLNAASNLKLDLFLVPYWVRQQQINRKGFLWKSDGLFYADGKPIVSHAQKATDGNKKPC